ncbi:MAG: DUF1801 domain-containing protein [Dehalococcoidia bacterium]|nr:MAG: DUF1801 domain-containing protein [Dehalococcoidia bacterium]
MSGKSDVDAFVRKNVLPQFREVVEQLRQIMREAAQDATEEIAYRIPMWRRRRIFVFLNPTKKDITFGFSRGREFEDKYGLLRGVGKSSMHLKFKTAAEIKPAVVRYYIKQAIKHDNL